MRRSEPARLHANAKRYSSKKTDHHNHRKKPLTAKTDAPRSGEDFLVHTFALDRCKRTHSVCSVGWQYLPQHTQHIAAHHLGNISIGETFVD